MTLWSGRFSEKLDPRAWELNASITFDQRLGRQDVSGSLAWARGLQRAGLLTMGECNQLCGGLEAIAGEMERGEFGTRESDEDIHSAVERRLGELVGPLAGKLHSGRSRNDQVATDLRMWLLDHLPILDAALIDLQEALIYRAEQDMDILMPGYTHLQRAQPVLLSHWWLSHFWPLQRDRVRFLQISENAAILPLGSGALAGTPFPVERSLLAQELGFKDISSNSLDAVSDRDFVAEYLFSSALGGVHLSRLSEGVILFSSAEFGFFELSDAYATGSSLMPQKKNPDVFELARGKAGVLLGNLAGWLATLKGLPSAYDKDLQGDKLLLFAAYDTLVAVLPVIAGALGTLAVHPQRMLAAIDASLMATDLADYFVERGIPFRQAHGLVGQAVQRAAALGLELDSLDIEEYRSLQPSIEPDVYSVFDPQRSVARRSVTGGTAPEAVRSQLKQARQLLADRARIT
jgi:argininosuccinate lyase